MNVHPDYVELVKTALVSDAYWYIPEDELSFEQVTPASLVNGIRSLNEEQRLRTSEEMARQIGSVLTSVGEGDTVEPVPYGESIPIPHGRQVIQVVEDSRHVINRFSPSHLLMRAFDAKHSRKMKKEHGEDYKPPSFEEDLEAMYGDSPFVFPATATLAYDMTHLAIIKRSVLYLKKDHESGLFLGLNGIAGKFPDQWDSTILEIVPDVKIGTTYSKDPNGGINHLGKIISADVVEATRVTWKQGDKPPGNDKKDEKARNALNPKPIKGISST